MSLYFWLSYAFKLLVLYNSQSGVRKFCIHKNLSGLPLMSCIAGKLAHIRISLVYEVCPVGNFMTHK